jgi:hypothetical protein
MINKLRDLLKMKAKKRLEREDNVAPLSKMYKQRLEKEEAIRRMRGK